MADNVALSRQPGRSSDTTGQMSQILNKFGLKLQVMLPASIIAYDRSTNRASVQLLINVLMTDGTTMGRARIASIPVKQFGGGGFIASTPINPGDLGYVQACDRDWSAFQQTYAQSAPNTLRSHSFEDGLFVPDPMTGYTIAEDQTFVLQSLDGTTAIIMDEAKITIKVDDAVIVIEPTTISIDAPAEINLTAPIININGELNMNGNDITNIAGVSPSYSGHTHGGVQSGGSTTTDPNG